MGNGGHLDPRSFLRSATYRIYVLTTDEVLDDTRDQVSHVAMNQVLHAVLNSVWNRVVSPVCGAITDQVRDPI